MSPACGVLDLAAVLFHPTEIFFLVIVHHPVARVGARIERRRQPEIDENAHQKHPAIDADAVNVAIVVIGRSDPSPRFGDDGGALRRRFRERLRHRAAFDARQT